MSVARLAAVLLACVLLAVAATPAAGQEEEQAPPGPFAVDVRGSLARYGQNLELASNLNLPVADLASRGLGLDVGAHWYLFTWRAITFGIGASYLISRGEREPPAKDDRRPAGPTLRTRFSAFAPQLSFNFGTRRGWSYLSGGIASSRFEVTALPAEEEAPTRRAETINYGGGARWFARSHLAFTFDVRFYAVSPLPEGGPNAPKMPRMTLMVVSVGVSFK